MRIKKVFRSAEVAHIWAQQKQNEGRNPQGNMYFRGKSIFSYGEHFEMARFVRPDVVLRTNRTYSVTTAKQLHYVVYACNHLTMFTVPSFENHSENALYLANEAKQAIDQTNRSHKRISDKLQNISNFCQIALDYLDLFKKEIEVSTRKEIRTLDKYFHKVLSQDRIDLLKKRENKANEQEKIRRAERQRIASLDYAEKLALWIKGEYNGYLNSWNQPVVLRIKDNEIQTTKRASIPLLAARELWDKIVRCEPLHGLTLGNYTVTSFDGSLLKVGCHEIPIKEIYRMAKGLNWLDQEAVTI